MNTLICAGGSGQRVLEAVLHLCAAGLGPKSLRLLVIDPDGANGNHARVVRLLERYRTAQSKFGEELGPKLGLFRTELDMLDAPGAQSGLKNWSPVKPRQKLADLLNVEGLTGTGSPRELVDLFFTADEVNMELDQGFRGHPSIGAAAMSLVSLYGTSQPWAQIAQNIKNDLTQAEGSRVFIAGSVFGGTGASAIHPIVRFLRKIPDSNAQRLKIGVAALVPYFRFASSSADKSKAHSEMAAKSERFPLATRSSVQFYDYLSEHGDWEFDAMYWIGDNSPVPVEFAPGGNDQENDAHFVELLAALTAIEFFGSPDKRHGSSYAGPRADVAPELGEANVVDWEDLPLVDKRRIDVEKTLLRFLLMGWMHCGFYKEMFAQDSLDERAYCVPWYQKRFAKRDDLLSTHERTEDLALLSEFFETYHLPWWAQVLSGDNVRLFNRAGFERGRHGRIEPRLDRLGNLLYPDRPGEANLDQVDRFFSLMVGVPGKQGVGGNGVAAYVGLLASAADRFIKSEYRIEEKGDSDA